MSDNLRELLNDKAGQVTTGLGAGEATGQGAAPASSETVLSLDKWGVRRGNDLSQEWREAELGDVDPNVAADAHGALFEAYPVRASNPGDAARAAYWKQLMETPEYVSLHGQTMLDPEMSALAAKGICDEYAKYSAENPPPAEGEDAPAPGSDGESIDAQLARIRSTGKALDAAREDVSTANDVADGLGMGGKGGGAVDHRAIANAFRRVRNSDLLRDVMQMAGRMISRCRTLQRQKLHARRGEITGIELGGDLGRLIPRERLALAGGVGPELQERAEYRLLKRRSLCYRQKLNTPVGAGPIVVGVDESGSMYGEKNVAAKAIALTMAWLADQQNRWIALVGFSGTNRYNVESHSLAIPPGRRDPDQLIEWVEHFFSGGSDFDCPCREIPDTLWSKWLGQGLKRGKTDVIIISDAVVNCPAEIRDSYLKWAGDEQVKTYGIVVGPHTPGYLGEVANRCWCLPKLDLETSAVEEVLSI